MITQISLHLPEIFAVAGALVWGFSKDKVAEAGKLTFLAGMIGICIHGLHF